MIKKLRKKFILLALAVVAAVIVVIVAGIDVANYISMKNEADDVISFIEQRESAAPTGKDALGSLPPDLTGNLPPQGIGEKPKGLPLQTAFSARYFTVETDKDGKYLSSDLGNIAFVSESDVSGYLSKATSDCGFVGNYRYHRVETETGYRYLFLDCEKEISATRTFIVSSAIITAVGLAAIALLIILLSKKVLAPVEETYKKQKRFITDAGHELKTPLTVISANAELLELEIGEGNEWLESIKGQVKKMTSLTKELVFLSRMDEAEQMIQKAPFSLKSALEDCADGLKEASLVAGKTIALSLEDVTVNGNEEMMRRAINLVLDNAIKYAESGEITLSLRREGKWAVIEQSNAASFEKGEHNELFERFYRPDTSRNTATGGHGVGLSVVKSILEAHGGSATAESDGKNIVFRLTLPN